MGIAPFALTGDVDLANSAEIGEQLLLHVQGLVDVGPEVLIDCTGLTFIDSTGLSMLLNLTQRTSRRLVLKGLSAGCRRPFEVTGLDEVFVID